MGEVGLEAWFEVFDSDLTEADFSVFSSIKTETFDFVLDLDLEYDADFEIVGDSYPSEDPTELVFISLSSFLNTTTFLRSFIWSLTSASSASIANFWEIKFYNSCSKVSWFFKISFMFWSSSTLPSILLTFFNIMGDSSFLSSDIDISKSWLSASMRF